MSLLLRKQSDLGLRCLSRPLCKATSVRSLRMFIVHEFTNTLSHLHADNATSLRGCAVSPKPLLLTHT